MLTELIWNVSLQLTDPEQDDLTAIQRNLIRDIQEGAQIIELSGTDAAPEARVRIVQSIDLATIFLLLGNLHALPPDQSYEVWRIMDDVPVSIGTFELAGDSERFVTLGGDLSGANAIGISVEQKGGSTTGQPMGPIVLLGAVAGRSE